MDPQATGLLGAKGIREVWLDFFRCPECSRPQETLSSGREELAQCNSCKRRIPPKDWGTVKVRRKAAICSGCDNLVSLTSETRDWTGHHCAECSNLVAVPYGRGVVAPQEILKPTWTPEMIGRAQTEGDIRWAVCPTKREYLVARLLYLLAASEEDSNFIYGSEAERKTMLCFDEKNFWGYLFWSQNRDGASGRRIPILRQLFLREEFRSKGLGKAFVRTWIEQIALPLAPSFGVETPNARTQRILVSLGHARFEGDRIVGKTCNFVPSM